VPQLIVELTIDLGRPNLHQRVSAMERPAHLLLLDHPPAREIAAAYRVVATVRRFSIAA
jgi:hypothetical protein